MGVSTKSDLDCVKAEGQAERIRFLAETIAHNKTYEEGDTALMEIELKSMREQARINNV
jgi:hypothetical protein